MEQHDTLNTLLLTELWLLRYYIDHQSSGKKLSNEAKDLATNLRRISNDLIEREVKDLFQTA